MNIKKENVFLPKRSLVQALKTYCNKKENEKNVSDKKQEEPSLDVNQIHHHIDTNRNSQLKKHIKFSFFEKKQANQERYQRFFIKSKAKGNHHQNQFQLKSLRPLYPTKKRHSTQNSKFEEEGSDHEYYLAFKERLKLDFENKSSFYRFRISKSKSNRQEVLKQEKPEQIQEDKEIIRKNNFISTAKDGKNLTSNFGSVKSQQKIVNKATISDLIKPVPNFKHVLSYRNQSEHSPKRMKGQKIVRKKGMKLQKVDEWRESVRGWTKYPLHSTKQEQYFPKCFNQNETFLEGSQK